MPLRFARFGIQAIETPLISFSTKVIAESCFMLILHIFMQLEHRFRGSFLIGSSRRNVIASLPAGQV